LSCKSFVIFQLHYDFIFQFIGNIRKNKKKLKTKKICIYKGKKKKNKKKHEIIRYKTRHDKTNRKA